ncbi:hypothetical protein PBI_ORION_79 [Mycobacterium phage Orion]|uniref:Uncharacterized protein n=26 Tax=Pegunavirus TaxID=1623295 RepID=Q716J6_9CAUD|nr:hypothetical protein PBI_PG1_79 [Mycobacterium phage PG1]YP_009168256.1 hypothetical protein UNCLEHOWIE_76 [Mycobacterium phage UncleHowie]YP_010096583.1 hypothetical protein KNT94_gp70 [Mycobacterium phage KingTut]YP_655175.1 gp79 [Mycobacterium phage Orion]ACI12801.1 hypothetical protein CHAH_81 [Mycobacterium phage Chah]ADA83905.1 hypothetical protein FANG_80 [Mycobacterium phage Fang]ADA84008.1 hypothetical protein SCOOT17C_80 [Mycobacterium phage Scoot17C]AEO94018.1 hypothetical prot
MAHLNDFVARNARAAAIENRRRLEAELAADGIHTLDDLNAEIDAYFA